MTDETPEDRPRLATLRDIETVYQPAEDSRLLAETAVDANLGAGDRVLDVGTGSGYVAARLREATPARVVGSDISPAACRQAHEAGVRTVRADLLGPFRSGVFDLVVCNPPYLPTPPEQEWGDPMERALSGGPDGRAVVDRLLPALPRVLAPGGRALVLVSSLTDPDAVRETAADAGLDSRIAVAESHPFERLLVLELAPDSD